MRYRPGLGVSRMMHLLLHFLPFTLFTSCFWGMVPTCRKQRLFRDTLQRPVWACGPGTTSSHLVLQPHLDELFPQGSTLLPRSDRIPATGVHWRLRLCKNFSTPQVFHPFNSYLVLFLSPICKNVKITIIMAGEKFTARAKFMENILWEKAETLWSFHSTHILETTHTHVTIWIKPCPAQEPRAMCHEKKKARWRTQGLWDSGAPPRTFCPRKWHLSRDLKDTGQQTMWISGARALRAERASLRQQFKKQ